jgi:hypothetical protein
VSCIIIKKSYSYFKKNTVVVSVHILCIKWWQRKNSFLGWKKSARREWDWPYLRSTYGPTISSLSVFFLTLEILWSIRVKEIMPLHFLHHSAKVSMGGKRNQRKEMWKSGKKIDRKDKIISKWRGPSALYRTISFTYGFRCITDTAESKFLHVIHLSL